MQSEIAAPSSLSARGWRRLDIDSCPVESVLSQDTATAWRRWGAIFSAVRLCAYLMLLAASLFGASCGSSAGEGAVEPGAASTEPALTVLSVPKTPRLAPLVVAAQPAPGPTLTTPPPPAATVLIQLPTPTPSPIFITDPDLGATVPALFLASPVTRAGEPSGLAHLFTERPEVGASVRWPSATAVTLAPTPDGVERTVQAPILMYHYLSTPPANADLYRRDLSVPPALFDQHLARIHEEGYTSVSLYDLVAYLNQGTPLPAKPVVITFDDGYRDNYENALPLLLKHGMIATFFIVTDFIDEQRPEYLTWEMVRAMAAAGMSIESHGRNHVSLRGKDADYLVWQALGSLETIEYELGVRPRFVSYPAGEYDRLTLEIFRSANYWGGVTTIQGATHTSDNLFELRRVRIRGTTTPDELARLLALDW